MTIIFILVYVFLPALILYLCDKIPALGKIGAVLLCYLAGMILGNSGLLPEQFLSVQNLMSEATVALALPLLLFSLDVKSWSRVAGKAILSMLLSTIAVVTVVFFIFISMRDNADPEFWKLTGMSVGVYTGGTPNLAAIKTALSVKDETYILFHTYDMVISLIYIFFTISIAQKIFNRFLPRFNYSGSAEAGLSCDKTESINAYHDLLTPGILPRLVIALFFSVLVVGISLFIGGLIPEDYRAAGIIMLITSFGIGLSFIPRIRNIRRTFQGGMYIIYIFCIVVASMTNFSSLTSFNPRILIMVGGSIIGALIIHALLCRLFKVDTDTFLVTSVAAICSPPFVPVVAGALNNQKVILSGLTTGIIGYAIGNYLGISLAYLFRAL